MRGSLCVCTCVCTYVCLCVCVCVHVDFESILTPLREPLRELPNFNVVTLILKEQPHVQGAVAARAQEGLEELLHIQGQEGR